MAAIPPEEQAKINDLTPGIPFGTIIRSSLVQTGEGRTNSQTATGWQHTTWIPSGNTVIPRTVNVINSAVFISPLEYISPKIFDDSTFIRNWDDWDGVSTTNPNQTHNLASTSEHVGWERKRFHRTRVTVQVHSWIDPQTGWVTYTGASVPGLGNITDIQVSASLRDGVVTGTVWLNGVQWRWPLHLRQYDADDVPFYWGSLVIRRGWIQNGFIFNLISPPRDYGSDRQVWYWGGPYTLRTVHESPDGDLYDADGNRLEEEYDEETGNRYVIVEREVTIICPDTGEERTEIIRERIPVPPRRPRWQVGANPRMVFNEPQSRFIITNTQNRYMLHSPDGNAWESGNMVFDPRTILPQARTVLTNNGAEVSLFDTREFSSTDARLWSFQRTLPVPAWWGMGNGVGSFVNAVTLSTSESLAFVLANLDLVGFIDFPVDGNEIWGPIMVYGNGVYILATEGAEDVHVTYDYAETWDTHAVPVRLGVGLLGCYGMDFWVIGQRAPIEGNNVSNIFDGTMWGSIPMPPGCVDMAAGAEVFAAVRPDPVGGFLPDESAVIFLPIEDAWDDDDDD